MKRLSIVLLVLLSATLYAQQQQTSAPEIPYTADANALKLPPDMNWGEVAGIALNSQRHVFVYQRKGNSTGPARAAQSAQLLEFGPDGKLIKEWGRDLYGFSMAHNVRIDKYDNIWVVDEGSNMFIKFNPQGRVVMVWGRKAEAIADWESLHEARGTAGAPPREPPPIALGNPNAGGFARPTDVAWDAQDNAFFSDGYINARVVKVDKDGRGVTSWGTHGKGPSQFNTVHTIAVDAQGTVYVGDRGNNRIQVFDNDGKFLHEWIQGGSPNALCMTSGPKQVLFSQDLNGRFYKLEVPSGKLLGAFGKTGKLVGEFNGGHALACPSENELWVGELFNWRVQKLTLRPSTPPSR